MCLHVRKFEEKVMANQKRSFPTLGARWSLIVLLILLCDGTSFGQEAEEHPSKTRSVLSLSGLLSSEEGIASLKREYHTIQGGQRRPWTVASLPENIKKNRYDDLLAFDDTRVVLDKLPNDPNSDYINANYIDGYNRQREYVATQGPLPNTLNDFWRMIWQLNANKVIMLANLIEHGSVKVEKYWPEVNQTYGQIVVVKLSEHSIGNEHVVRTFMLKKSGDPETRILRHFHFTGWPDMGVPSDRLSVVSLVQQARKYRPESTTPIVVHCSAGVGRTGTVIMTDSQIERAKSENTVNFPAKLDHMRVQRVDVVEKEEQYVFGHKAINDVFNKPESGDYLRHIDEMYRAALGEEDAAAPSSGSRLKAVIYALNPLNYF